MTVNAKQGTSEAVTAGFMSASVKVCSKRQKWNELKWKL